MSNIFQFLEKRYKLKNAFELQIQKDVLNGKQSQIIWEYIPSSVVFKNKNNNDSNEKVKKIRTWTTNQCSHRL